MCQHREAGSIEDALDFSLEKRYCTIVHIDTMGIIFAAKSGCRQHQLAVAHAEFLSIHGLEQRGKSDVILVHWDKRCGMGVRREAG